jgi:tRNA(Ile)-lysidine synthase
MNEDISFNRVRIRKELLPFLAEFNPNVVETLARTSETLLELRLVIEFLIGQNEAIDGMVKSERLRVSALRELPAQVRITLVREWIRNQRKTLRGVSSAHLNGIVALALSTKSGKEAELPGGLRIIKANGHLQLK